MTVYLGIGSNEGDRMANVREALQRIGALPGTKLEAVSGIIGTKPQGEWREGERRQDFLNCCCRIGTEIPPQELLDALKGIEKAMGRRMEPVCPERGRRLYSDRPIDIDILLYGDLTINTESLQIPHPRMQERDFVMIPLKEILK